MKSAALVLLGVAVLGGCASAGGEGVPSASSSGVVVTPSSSLSLGDAQREAVLEQLPSIARTETIQGGVAVAKAFIEEHPALFQEGPSEVFAFLSMPECEYCASEQERAQRDIAEWGHQVGGDMVVSNRYTIFKVDTEKFGEPTLIVAFDVSEKPYTFVNPAGEVTRSGEGTELRAGLALQLRDGIWRVLTFFFEEAEVVEVPPEIRDLLEQGPDA
jgi:hypothetical protein